jgi:hypothetical protein
MTATAQGWSYIALAAGFSIDHQLSEADVRDDPEDRTIHQSITISHKPSALARSFVLFEQIVKRLTGTVGRAA